MVWEYFWWQPMPRRQVTCSHW